MSESSQSSDDNLSREQLMTSHNRSTLQNKESIGDVEQRELIQNNEMPNSGQMLMIPTLDNANDMVSTTTLFQFYRTVTTR